MIKWRNAWSDVESIGENIGKTAQLFGASFEDGLGDLTELYNMYQNFQDDKFHERITEQLAKNNRLWKKAKFLFLNRLGLALTRSQVRASSLSFMVTDTEFMMKSIKYEKDLSKISTNGN